VAPSFNTMAVRDGKITNRLDPAPNLPVIAVAQRNPLLKI
jgi:hypothetical protein